MSACRGMAGCSASASGSLRRLSRPPPVTTSTGSIARSGRGAIHPAFEGASVLELIGRDARSAVLYSVRLPEALARRCSRSLPRCCHGNPFSPLGRQLQSLPLPIFRRGIVAWAIASRAECRIAFGTRPETRNRAEPRRFRAIEIQPLQGLIWGRTRSVIAAGRLAAFRLRRAASASAVRRGRRVL